MRPIPRIIPCLLINENHLVKTINFQNEIYVGDPINAIKIFNEKEVDEILVIDISASKIEKEPNFDLISKIARECRMPLCYSGGIKNISQAQTIIHFGVEKIGISSAILSNERFVSSLANEIGNQSVAVILDLKYDDNDKKFKIFFNNGRTKYHNNADDFLNKILLQQPGEIIFNSIDRDGTLMGYDERILETFYNKINCPITLLGGANTYDQMKSIAEKYSSVGFGVGSKFTLNGKFKAVLISYISKNEKYEFFES